MIEIARVSDGRPVTRDDGTELLSIGGTPVTIKQLMGYDRTGQLTWADAEQKAWAYEVERVRLSASTRRGAVWALVAAVLLPIYWVGWAVALENSSGLESETTIGWCGSFGGFVASAIIVPSAAVAAVRAVKSSRSGLAVASLVLLAIQLAAAVAVTVYFVVAGLNS